MMYLVLPHMRLVLLHKRYRGNKSYLMHMMQQYRNMMN